MILENTFINEFNLIKADRGTKGYDALTIENKKVQIKAIKTGLD